MPEFTSGEWEDAFYYSVKVYLASVAARAAAMKAILAGGDIEHIVSKPGNGSTGPTECQILVQDLIEEGKAFKGGVPVASRPTWLKKIEACKGKVPESEYAEALQILHAKG
jgi:hypothetical protein